MAIVTLGGHTIQLKKPASATQRYETWLAVSAIPDRAFAAALGACLPDRKGSPVTLVHRYDMTCSPLVYGGQVLDELLSQGFHRNEIRTAGIIAHNWISEEFGLETEAEEAKLVDFSEAPESAT